jgi:Flp pilus assembly protein TadB
MVIFMFAIGVLMVATTGRLVAHAIALPRVRFKRHLRELLDYGFQPDPEADGAAAGGESAALTKLAERLGRFTIANLSRLPQLRRGELAAAGYYDISPEAIHGYRGLAAASLALVVALGGFALVGPSLITLLVILAAAAAGWQLPAIAIRHRGDARLEDIDKELPELIDLLIATVEAGMGFGGALGLAASRLKGSLGDEVRLTVRQQNLGISTSEALEGMLERCDTQSMRGFVRTVVRGESMGLSIAPILRELATDMRRRRRQASQERMHKAPVKILFPLMFLIMPALMIVLFYPAAYSVMNGLSGLN